MTNVIHHTLSAGLVLISSIAMADAPSSDPNDGSGISVSGAVDIGYTNMNSTGLYVGSTKALPLGSRVLDAPNARQDKNINSLALNQVAVAISRQPKEGFGAVLNLMGGQDSNALAAWGAGNSGGYAYDNHHNLDVTLAYVTYVTGALTASAGKLLTLIGAEGLSNVSNTNYSHAILFGNPTPATHAGARLAYALDDQVTLIAGVNNGWDTVPATTDRKTIELGFSAKPDKMLSVIGSYYTGYELADGYTSLQSTVGRRQIIDLVATINLTDQFSLVLNFDDASQGNAMLAQGGRGTARFDGLAIYLNYQLNDQWRASLRGEAVSDPNGYTAGFVGKTGQTSKEATLTLTYMPVKSFEIRGEVRQDRSNQAIFLQTNGLGKNEQTSFGLELIYKF